MPLVDHQPPRRTYRRLLLIGLTVGLVAMALFAVVTAAAIDRCEDACISGGDLLAARAGGTLVALLLLVGALTTARVVRGASTSEPATYRGIITGCIGFAAFWILILYSTHLTIVQTSELP